jgi:hypothetical protein
MTARPRTLPRTLPALLIPAVAALLIASGAVAVRAQQSPITVKSCTLLAYSASSPHEFFYLQSGPPSQSNRSYTDGLKISYVNTSTKVISRVGFRVIYRGKSERVIDAGTISPGITITKTLGDFSGQPYLGATPDVCVPVGVRFQDGTVWRASSTPAP